MVKFNNILDNLKTLNNNNFNDSKFKDMEIELQKISFLNQELKNHFKKHLDQTLD